MLIDWLIDWLEFTGILSFICHGGGGGDFFSFFDFYFVVFLKGGYANGNNPRRPASQSAGGWEAKHGDSEDNWRGAAHTFVRQSSNREGGPYGGGFSKRGRRGVEYGSSIRGVGHRSTHSNNNNKSWRIGPCVLSLLEILPPPSSPPVESGSNRRPRWAKHKRSGKNLLPCSSKNLPHTHNGVLVRCGRVAVGKKVFKILNLFFICYLMSPSLARKDKKNPLFFPSSRLNRTKKSFLFSSYEKKNGKMTAEKGWRCGPGRSRSVQDRSRIGPGQSRIGLGSVRVSPGSV